MLLDRQLSFNNRIINDNTQIQGVQESIIWFLTLQDWERFGKADFGQREDSRIFKQIKTLG